MKDMSGPRDVSEPGRLPYRTLQFYHSTQSYTFLWALWSSMEGSSLTKEINLKRFFVMAKVPFFNKFSS